MKIEILKNIFRGFSEKTSATDRLYMKTKKAPRVFCVKCNSHIYYLRSKKTGVTPDNLAPLQGGKKPHNFDCPQCGQEIVAYTPQPTFKTSEGYFHV